MAHEGEFFIRLGGALAVPWRCLGGALAVPWRCLGGALVLLLMGSALRAQSIDMQYVTVGNPGNAPDPATGHQYGEVDYTFDIGEYDVTDSQYCTFLNAVDPSGANTLSLYDSSANNAEYGISLNSGAANGSKYSVISGYANMPVVDVDYWDTLRFANYLDDGNTESGAYTLLVPYEKICM